MLAGTTLASPQRWRLVDGQQLRFHRWGDECVLFNDVTGDTHLLDLCAFDLLLQLQKGDASAVSLEHSMAATMGNPDRGNSAAFLGDLLNSLEEATLVERGED